MSESDHHVKLARIYSSSTITDDEGIHSCRLHTRPAASLDNHVPALRPSQAKNNKLDADAGLESASQPKVPSNDLKRGSNLISSADPPQLSSNSFIFTGSNSNGSAEKRNHMLFMARMVILCCTADAE